VSMPYRDSLHSMFPISYPFSVAQIVPKNQYKSEARCKVPLRAFFTVTRY
jgi:hypothetical protein